MTMCKKDWIILKDYIEKMNCIDIVENDNGIKFEISYTKWNKLTKHIISYERSSPQFHGLYCMMKFGKSEIKIGKSYKHPDILSNYDYNSRGNGAGYLLIGYWHGLLYYNFEQSILNHDLIKPYRIKNKHGHLSEWVNITLNTLKYVVDQLTNKYIHEKEYETKLSISNELSLNSIIYKYSLFSEKSTIDNIIKIENVDNPVKNIRVEQMMTEIIYKCDYKNYCIYCNTSCEEKNPLYNCTQCYVCNGLRKYQEKQILKNATEKLKNINLVTHSLNNYKLIDNMLPKHELFLRDCFITQEYIFQQHLFHWDTKESKFYFSRKELYDYYCNTCKDPIKDTIFTKTMLSNKLITDCGQKNIAGVRPRCCYIDPVLYTTISCYHDLDEPITLNLLIRK